MKHLFVVAALLCLLVSCANHGKKVMVEGTKTEVFYKGDGVNETDAKKVGDLLKARFIQSNDKKGSIQITRDDDTYTMRFVYDKEIYKTLKDVDNEFKALAYAASKEVFSSKKVNIALADDQFKDWKTIAWDADFAKTMENPTTGDDDGNAKAGFDHQDVGNLHFYWAKNIPDEDAEKIGTEIVQQGALGNNYGEFYITNENGKTTISFPIKEGSESNQAAMALMESIGQNLKDKVFQGTPFSFQVTDVNLRTIKSWDF